MPKRMTDPYRPLFDIASYARRGPGRRDRLSPAEVQQIARTVDLLICATLRSCCKVNKMLSNCSWDIRVIDHIIVAAASACSLAERGLL